MHRNIYNYDVLPGKGKEAEKFLKDRASRLKGSPGFLGCCILKEIGHDSAEEHEHDTYAFIHDWRSPQDLQTFEEKNATTSREFFARAQEMKGVIETKSHGHYEVIFQL